VAADPLLMNTALVSDLLSDGKYNLSRICASLRLKAADLGTLTARSTESVARSVAKDAFTQPEAATEKVSRELVQIVGLLRAMKLEADAGTWFKTPLPSYKGRTPLELVSDNKGQELISRLLGLAAGDVGG
jgi:uncharacterized protein (DUF2384 family)